MATTVKDDTYLRAALMGRKLTGTVIDAHAHLGPWFNFPIPHNDIDGMIHVMDRVGVGVVCPSACASVGPDFRLGNDLAAGARRRFPRRVIPYITLNPNYGDEGCLDELRRCEKFGLRHLKVHDIHGKPYDDPAYRRAYEHANVRGAVVLAHTWGAVCTTLARLAKEYPRLNFLLAHSGAGGYKDYLAAVEAAPNVYLELAYSNSQYGSVEYLVRHAGADRVVFGSDMPFLSLTHQIGKVLCAAISPADKRKILGSNAKRLFRI